MSRIPTVDAHQHFWGDPTPEEYPWITDELRAIRRPFGPEDLRPLLGDTGIDSTVLVQTRSSLEETREFLALASRLDFVAGVVGWVDLTDPHVDRVIDALRSGPGGRYLVGIRHQVHDEEDPAWLLRDGVRHGLEAVGAAGLVYDLLVRPRELGAAYDVARRLPEMRFVIDHVAKPPIRSGEIDEWAEGMAPFADLGNVCCKLSGMVTEADWAHWTADDLRPYVERVLGWFGPERLMAGSDWPVCLLAASYTQVFETCRALLAGLSGDAQAQVLGGTAARVYRLDVEGPVGPKRG